MKQSSLNILSIIAIAVLMLTATPAMATETTAPALTEQDAQPVSFTVTESTLHVINGENMTLEIYSLTGTKVFSMKIDSPSKNIDLSNLQSGVYIVKVGKVVRKVCLK
jgi:hypothetical protein